MRATAEGRFHVIQLRFCPVPGCPANVATPLHVLYSDGNNLQVRRIDRPPALCRDAAVVPQRIPEAHSGNTSAERLQPMERRIQRSCLHLQQFFRSLLNVLGNRVTMSGPGKQGAEDQQVERALQQPDSRCRTRLLNRESAENRLRRASGALILRDVLFIDRLGRTLRVKITRDNANVTGASGACPTAPAGQVSC